MVSTSARNAGGPWFDSRSRHDRFLYANSVCLYIYIYISFKTRSLIPLTNSSSLWKKLICCCSYKHARACYFNEN